MPPPAILVTSVAAAGVPTLFYVLIIYWADRYEKEPFWLVAAAFFWGAVPSIIIAFILNTLLSIPIFMLAGNTSGEALAASIIAPPVEESLKGMALLAIFILWRHEIDSPLDGIIYGAMVGMGFAMAENIYYFVDTYDAGGLEAWGVNIFLRAVIFGLNHALFSSVTGLGIALARMSVKPTARYVLPIAGWFGAVTLHFLHNLAVSSGNLLCLMALLTDWGGVGITVVIIIWALLQERRWLVKYLAEEVTLGTLTYNQFQVASSGRQRNAQALRLLFSHGVGAYANALRFHQRCSELAYKKHHYALFQTEDSRRRIDQARIKTLEMARRMATVI